MVVEPMDRALAIRITLRDVEPPVWRDVAVRESSSLNDVHTVIQACMGWADRHLYEFRWKGQVCGTSDPESEANYPGVDEVRLRELKLNPGDTIDYLYDYGDGWEHQVEVVSTMELDPKLAYPVCVGGHGSCPPEDCGGPPGYEQLQAAMADPDGKGSGELLEWLGNSSVPEAFSVVEANTRLSGKSDR